MHLLAVPHKQQETEVGCLAACAQMVLAYWGVEQSQTDLNRFLGLTSIGTPFSNIQRLRSAQISVVLEIGIEIDLRGALENRQPIIAFLFTKDLPYWVDNTSHAVVVIGYDEMYCILNDPAFGDAPQKVPWDDFMLAWSEHDYACALVTL
jgi:ABC-type bacteriocin/lantibiotic exporter with double-glycine peptidase domain